jgi:hypothetical protein
MERTLPSLVFGLTVVLAGCIGTSPPSVPSGDDAAALAAYALDEFPVDVDHDHADAALHDAAYHVVFAGYHACTPDGGLQSAVGGYTDIAFHGVYAFVGHAQGFCILDLTDPVAPRFVSSYEGEAAADIDVSADGDYVFLPTQRNRVTNVADPDDAPTANLPRGISVVNVRDKTKPVFESYYPVPTNGVHTLTPYRLGDRQLVFVQSYDWVPPGELGLPSVPVPQQNPAPTQRIEVTELKRLPTGAMGLELLARWFLPRPATEPNAMWFPHDSFAQQHPITKQHLLYVAYWDAGLVTLDVSDPSQPRLLSQYDDKAPSIYNQYHDVKVFDQLIEGRHITVTGPELSSGPEAGHVRVFDTTDPTKPVQLGTWRLPGNPGTPGGRIYIGHNHAGVWVIDVHNETRLHAPATVGFYFPRGDEAHGELSKTSSVWGAYWRDGYVYATEASSGVHVLQFAGDVVIQATLAAP